MTNLPLKALPGFINRNLVSNPTATAPELDAQAVLEKVAESSEASIISLPRVAARNQGINQDPSSVLESLMTGLKSGGELVEAHQGLDAARVFDLLNDDE